MWNKFCKKKCFVLVSRFLWLSLKKNSTKLEYRDESPPAWETSEFVMGFLASCFFLLLKKKKKKKALDWRDSLQKAFISYYLFDKSLNIIILFGQFSLSRLPLKSYIG